MRPLEIGLVLPMGDSFVEAEAFREFHAGGFAMAPVLKLLGDNRA